MKSDTGPFTLVPEWVLDSSISPRAIQLYAVLGRYADQEGECWPSRRTLAARLNCSDDSIDRAKQELLDLGALVWQRRKDENGSLKTNLYTLIRSAPVRLPTRKGEEGGTRKAAAENESQLEREPSLAPTASARERDLLFEAICESVGANPGQLTKAGRGSINAALKDLRAVEATPGEIATRAGQFKRRYPNAALTAPALAKHWATLGNGWVSPACEPTEEDHAELQALLEEMKND